VQRALRLALVDDYEIVLRGLARMFEAYEADIDVVELEIGRPIEERVDVVLFDTFAQHEADSNDVATLVANGRGEHVVVFTWSFSRSLITSALGQGAHGYLAKSMPAAALVDAMHRIAAGEIVVSEQPRPRAVVGLDWPGRAEGLSARESEILALITQGKSNAETSAMTYLSQHTVKSYLRDLYRKIGVRNRTEAALWGLERGFGVNPHRLDDWS